MPKYNFKGKTERKIMALRWTDFKFERIHDYQQIAIRFKENLGWLQMEVTIADYYCGNKKFSYECMHINYALPNLLEAFIDIIPEYAACDKYFHYFRRRSRFDHDAESRGLVRWELAFSGWDRFEILVRNNFDADMEDDYDYETLHNQEAINKVKGDVWLCVSVNASAWVKAVLFALDELYEAMPDNPKEDLAYSKANFPQQYYDKLKLWLETPSDSYKRQKLNPGKGFFENTEGVVIEPE